MSHGNGREVGTGEDCSVTALKQQRIPGRKRMSAAPHAEGKGEEALGLAVSKPSFPHDLKKTRRQNCRETTIR